MLELMPVVIQPTVSRMMTVVWMPAVMRTAVRTARWTVVLIVRQTVRPNVPPTAVQTAAQNAQRIAARTARQIVLLTARPIVPSTAQLTARIALRWIVVFLMHVRSTVLQTVLPTARAGTVLTAQGIHAALTVFLTVRPIVREMDLQDFSR